MKSDNVDAHNDTQKQLFELVEKHAAQEKERFYSEHNVFKEQRLPPNVYVNLIEPDNDGDIKMSTCVGLERFAMLCGDPKLIDADKKLHIGPCVSGNGKRVMFANINIVDQDSGYNRTFVGVGPTHDEALGNAVTHVGWNIALNVSQKSPPAPIQISPKWK